MPCLWPYFHLEYPFYVTISRPLNLAILHSFQSFFCAKFTCHLNQGFHIFWVPIDLSDAVSSRMDTEHKALRCNRNSARQFSSKNGLLMRFYFLSNHKISVHYIFLRKTL